MDRRSEILPLGNDNEEDSVDAQPQGAAALPDPQQALPQAQESDDFESLGETDSDEEKVGTNTPASTSTSTSGAAVTNQVGPVNLVTGAGQQPGQAAVQQPVQQPVPQDDDSDSDGDIIVNMSANKPTVNLNSYSGHPVGTALSGGGQEEFTVESWLRRVEIIASSAGWNGRQTAGNAALALAPNTPAERWYAYRGQGGALQDWSAFKKAIQEEFAPPETVMEKVAMFRSMKLNKGERIADYVNKLHLKFAKFETGLEPIWKGRDYQDETTQPDLKARRELVVKDVSKHLKMVMFAAGLPDSLVTEITKAKAETLDEMTEVCKLAEAAQAATAHKSKQVAAVAVEEKPGTQSMQEEIAKVVAAMMKGDKKKQEDKKPKDFSKATCYYCEKQGHISPQCTVKKDDRAKNIYKLTAKDQPRTKEQWDALPKEQKSWKGRQANKQQANSASINVQQASVPGMAGTWQGPPPGTWQAPPAGARGPPATAANWWDKFYAEN